MSIVQKLKPAIYTKNYISKKINNQANSEDAS